MTRKNRNKTDIRNKYLQDQSIRTLFESTVDNMIKFDQPISKRALKKQHKDLTHSAVEALYKYYAEDKRDRVELTCSILEKKLWKHKADKAEISVSKLANRSLNNAHIHVPYTAKLQKEIHAVVNERVRFNTLLNQLARWCNTHKSGVEAVQVLAELNHIYKAFEEHDSRVMDIIANQNGVHSSQTLVSNLLETEA